MIPGLNSSYDTCCFPLDIKTYNFLLPMVYSHSSISPQGAPESVLERCNYIRVRGSDCVPLNVAVRDQLLSTLRDWGSGRDTLRCLAMATRDTPPDIHTLNLENSDAFSNYEVLRTFFINVKNLK